MSDRGTVTVFRYDPAIDKEPRYDTYEIPVEAWRNVKVIDTLRYIYENLDPDLTFREPCRQQLCGACAMLVNKKSVLACDYLSEQEMIVEPLPKHPVLKDLVIDFSGGEKR